MKELKIQIQRAKPHLYPERQEFRFEPRGKGLDDNKTLEELGIKDSGKLYLKVYFKYLFKVFNEGEPS